MVVIPCEARDITCEARGITCETRGINCEARGIICEARVSPLPAPYPMARHRLTVGLTINPKCW